MSVKDSKQARGPAHVEYKLHSTICISVRSASSQGNGHYLHTTYMTRVGSENRDQHLDHSPTRVRRAINSSAKWQSQNLGTLSLRCPALLTLIHMSTTTWTPTQKPLKTPRDQQMRMPRWPRQTKSTRRSALARNASLSRWPRSPGSSLPCHLRYTSLLYPKLPRT